MGLIGEAAAAVVTLMTGTVVKILADDAKEWALWTSSRLMNRALTRLPACRREHYREEWSAHIQETPGTISKLTAAIGFGIAATRMNRELQADVRCWVDEVITVLKEVVAQQSALCKGLGTMSKGAIVQEWSLIVSRAEVYELLARRPGIEPSQAEALRQQGAFLSDFVRRFRNHRKAVETLLIAHPEQRSTFEWGAL